VSPVRLALIVLLALGGLQAASSGSQDATPPPAPDAEQAAKLEKYIDLARTGRIPVRPQAARRLVKLGAPAAARLLELAGEDGAGIEGMGQHLVEVLGEFDEAALRALLWQRVADAEFAWRSPAARTLALRPQATELERFFGFTRDPLAEVRRAGVLGLGTLDAERERGIRRLQELVGDPSDRVRRAAAAQLADWGRPAYLYVLSVELERTDTYFGVPFGEQARFAALRLLKERLGDDFGFRAEDAPDSEGNAAALGALRGEILERSGGALPMLPGLALAGGPTEGDVLGLELRSCRAGELFLRWNEADVLYVGTGRAAKVELPPGTVAELLRAARAATAACGDDRYWGEAGCDIEQVRVAGEDGALTTLLISKGQAAVPDLRPAALDALLPALLKTLPNAWPGPGVDPRLALLQDRAVNALAAIGGAPAAPSED